MVVVGFEDFGFLFFPFLLFFLINIKEKLYCVNVRLVHLGDNAIVVFKEVFVVIDSVFLFDFKNNVPFFEHIIPFFLNINDFELLIDLNRQFKAILDFFIIYGFLVFGVVLENGFSVSFYFFSRIGGF